MKTLVMQVTIGTPGYLYRDNYVGITDNFTEYLVPTVKRYCEKYGYDYIMITEEPKDRDVRFFNYSNKPRDFDYSTGGKNKSSTLVRYLNMDQPEYDVIVSLDNDIYIPTWAEPLPKIKGHMGVPDLGKPWEKFTRIHKLPQNKFINGGVQMVDRETGKKLHDYIAHVVDNKIGPIEGVHSDQSYMNYFRSQNFDNSYVLDTKWNFMVPFHNLDQISPYRKQNFVHYAGQFSRPIFENDRKRGLIE
jgi:hypothetical protein